MEIGHEQVGLRYQAGAEIVFAGGEQFSFLELAEALLAGPGTDGDALAGDEAHGTEAFKGRVDPAVHGDVGRANGIGIHIGIKRMEGMGIGG